jgi:hypothetical protein
MTKKIIHVLYWCYGQYEDARKIPLAASFSSESLEAVKETHLAKQQQIIAWKNQLAEWNAQYKTDHPQPIYPKGEKIPKWKPGIHMDEITPEMRAERDDIESRNQALSDSYGILMDAWSDENEKASELFLDTLNVPVEERDSLDYWRDSDYASFYKIEEIPWVE